MIKIVNWVKYSTSEINYVHNKNQVLKSQMIKYALVQGKIKHLSIEKKSITCKNHR